MEFPLLKCVACGATQDTAAVSQCCMDHLICKACVEKQTKKVLSPKSKEVLVIRISHTVWYLLNFEREKTKSLLKVGLPVDWFHRHHMEPITDDLSLCKKNMLFIEIENKNCWYIHWTKIKKIFSDRLVDSDYLASWASSSPSFR